MRTTNVFLSAWTLRGGRQACEEHEYKEFRFAELHGPPSLVVADASAWVVRYPLADEDLQLAAPPRDAGSPAGLSTF